MRVAVFGAGGVGAYFGGRLAEAGHDVRFIARGPHLAALRDGGLHVTSPLGDMRLAPQATDDPAAIGPCDWVLVTVKSYDTPAVADALDALVADHTGILSLQNGVDNEEVIGDRVGAGHVVGGVAFILSTIAEPGRVVHAGGPGRIVFGEMDGRESDRALGLLDALRAAGVEAEWSDDIRAVLWNKLAFICAQAGMTAASRLPTGRLREVPEARACFRRLSEEVCAVARAEGVVLPEDAPDRHLAFADSLGPGSHSSLHHDLVNGRRLELDALHGTVARRAARHGLAAPANEVIYALLKPWADDAEARFAAGTGA